MPTSHKKLDQKTDKMDEKGACKEQFGSRWGTEEPAGIQMEDILVTPACKQSSLKMASDAL